MNVLLTMADVHQMQYVQILKEVSYVLVILGILVLVFFVLVLFSFLFFLFIFLFQLLFQMIFFSLNNYFNTKTRDSNTVAWRNNIQFNFNFMEPKWWCNWLPSCNCWCWLEFGFFFFLFHLPFWILIMDIK